MVEITDQQVEKWLESFLKVIKEKYQPEKVLIFGSRARGDHLLESDVDMIIVSPKFEGINWIKRINEVADLWDGMVLLEPLCYTPMNLKKKEN